jgi:hypothetical protein
VIELEGRRGKLRIQLKNVPASYLATLSRQLGCICAFLYQRPAGLAHAAPFFAGVRGQARPGRPDPGRINPASAAPKISMPSAWDG